MIGQELLQTVFGQRMYRNISLEKFVALSFIHNFNYVFFAKNNLNGKINYSYSN